MRDSLVGVRLSKQEKDELATQAALAAISVSDYMRKRIFGHPVQARGDLQVLAEIRRQGGLLKHLYNETRGMYSEDFSRAIKANEVYYRDLLKKMDTGGEERL
jgi:hypothetical protein